jgi:hypothetical protein
MAPDARAVVLLVDLNVWIVRMCLARSMATLTGQALVLVLQELCHLIRMALFTGLLAGKDRFSSLQLAQRVASKPAILPERSRG